MATPGNVRATASVLVSIHLTCFRDRLDLYDRPLGAVGRAFEPRRGGTGRKHRLQDGQEDDSLPACAAMWTTVAVETGFY